MDAMSPDAVPLGEKREIDGQVRVFYYGYWIKTYPVPDDTLQAKKRLIEALTRRLFNHTEHGLNIPGTRLNEARAAYNGEADPELRRVKGAMLAGALFNRATDIFTKLVDLQAAGVDIQPDNALMRECGACLQEALQLGRMVHHVSGEEGIDELWGEPFKAFSIPIEDFFESRYIKIAQTMRDIDRIAATLVATFDGDRRFDGLAALVSAFATAAKTKCETLRTDPAIFQVWPEFAVAGERLIAFQPAGQTGVDDAGQRELTGGLQLIRQGRDLVVHITRARVIMPKTTREFVDRCSGYRQARRSLGGDGTLHCAA
jgi:hypothetical protein